MRDTVRLIALCAGVVSIAVGVHNGVLWPVIVGGVALGLYHGKALRR